MYSICQSGTLIQFFVFVCCWTRERNGTGREKTGSHPLPTYCARVAFDISSFPSKMILDVVKSLWLMFKKRRWQNDGRNRRTQYITCYIHALSESHNPLCSNGSRKYQAKCIENRLDFHCSLGPPQGRSAGSFPEQRLVIEPTLRIDTWSCLF